MEIGFKAIEPAHDLIDDFTIFQVCQSAKSSLAAGVVFRFTRNPLHKRAEPWHLRSPGCLPPGGPGRGCF